MPWHARPENIKCSKTHQTKEKGSSGNMERTHSECTLYKSGTNSLNAETLGSID